MNYLKVYCNLIRKAENRTPPDGYTEKHHIFPVSIYGKNNRIVVLTAREHYVAHALLEKICVQRYGLGDKRTIKMTYAHTSMVAVNGNNKRYYNSYLYENAKMRMSENIRGENHPFYGRKHTEASKNKMSTTRKKMGDYLKECGRRNGKSTYNKKVGIFAMSKERRSEISKNAGKIGGKIGGKTSYEKGVGFFALSTEELYNIRQNAGKQGSKITNSQKWMCLETGFITTSGALTRYQQKRNIDTSKRKRIS
jgi:hypothetical protein